MTIFIIVGIILIILAGIMFAVKDSITRIDYTEAIQKKNIDTEKIKTFISTCIQDVALEGVYILGSNGGYIKNQPEDTLKYGNSFIKYGLVNNKACSNVNFNIPEYPYENTDISEMDSKFDSVCNEGDGFFGRVVIPSKSSMEKEIADFVSENLESYADLSEIGRMMGLVINRKKEPKTKVLISPKDVSIFVEYPLEIKSEESSVEISEYYTSLDVPIGNMIASLGNSLSEDSKYIYFDTKDNLPSAKRIKDVCESCGLKSKDDIIEIKNNRMNLKNNPLIFRTAIEDRCPIIDHIDDIVVNMNPLQYPLIKEVNIHLAGIDPDDSNVNYIFMSLSKGLNGDGWHEHDSISNMIKNNLHNNILEFHVSLKDIGIHKAGIIVLKDDGLFDFQEFNIEVSLTGSLNPEIGCLNDCNNLYYEPGRCNSWCWISMNICKNECEGNFNVSGTDCYDCVENVPESSDNEQHVNCGLLSKQQCISKMPDCFWIKAKPDFNGKCYNDWNLDTLEYPSYIITA